MSQLHVYAHIKTAVVSTGGKLTGFYFLHLLYVVYYSVTMHLRRGKKVSYATDCGEMSEAHLVRVRGLGCPIQQSVHEVNIFPWEHMETSCRVT
jgi:hypothetical protein